jgi:hypothetical protein
VLTIHGAALITAEAPNRPPRPRSAAAVAPDPLGAVGTVRPVLLNAALEPLMQQE